MDKHKVLGLVDSFKGSLNTRKINTIIKRNLNKRGISYDYYLTSDGGEGFLDFISSIKQVNKLKVKARNPLGKYKKTYFLFDKEELTAYIELAKVVGVTTLKERNLNPFIASTYGVGEVILAAKRKGARSIILGIGGSATNDGGSGLVEALGVKFYKGNGQLITGLCNDKLKDVTRVDLSDFTKTINGLNFRVISDVNSPLLGPRGATYLYSSQKGAKLDELPTLEANMNNLSNIIESTVQANFSGSQFSGASGGVGFIMHALFKAEFELGINYLLEEISFERLQKNYDYFLTGEGKIDEQSLKGKIVFEIINKITSKNVIALCGVNEIKDFSLFKDAKVYSIVPNITTKSKSLKKPKKNFKKLVESIEFK